MFFPMSWIEERIEGKAEKREDLGNSFEDSFEAMAGTRSLRGIFLTGRYRNCFYDDVS